VREKSPGPRLGTKEGDYALVGPDWHGNLPSIPPQNVIQLDTNSMWIIGRFYTNGTGEDIREIVDNIYSSLTLTPLSSYITGESIPRPRTCRWIHLWTRIRRPFTRSPAWMRAPFLERSRR
jgi:hypothetical protein